MIESCPICLSSTSSGVHLRRTTVLIHAPVDRPLLEDDFAALSIVRCLQCGHLYNREFDERLIGRMYGDNPLTNVPVHRTMIDRLAGLADWLGDGTYADKRVLEIGGGSGHFACALARKARHVTIYEPRLKSTTEALTSSNVTVVNGLFGPHLKVEPADLVVCRQVLEHTVSPIQLLSAIRAALVPDGAAYIEIPAAEFIERHASPIDLCLQHVQYFSLTHFRYLAARAGLVVEHQLELVGGHDIGFLLRPAPPQHPIPMWHRDHVDDLKGRIETKTRHAKNLMETLRGPVALYGANSYGQAVLDLFPDLVGIESVFDDNESFDGYALCGGDRAIPIQTPSKCALSAISSVIVAAYLHDTEIARRLRAASYRGRILSMRPMPATPNVHDMETPLATD